MQRNATCEFEAKNVAAVSVFVSGSPDVAAECQQKIAFRSGLPSLAPIMPKRASASPPLAFDAMTFVIRFLLI